MNNYHLGAEHDRNAPYNHPDAEFVVCPYCNAEYLGCPECEGSGKVPRTFEDDLADWETAAEEKGDRIRNER